MISGCCALGGCAQSPWTEVSSERDGHALGETTGLTWRSADHWLRPLLARTAEPLAAASPASTPAASLAHGHRDTLLALIHPSQNTAATTDLHELRRGSSNREAGGQGGCVLTRPDVAAGLGRPVRPCAMVLLVCGALLGLASLCPLLRTLCWGCWLRSLPGSPSGVRRPGGLSGWSPIVRPSGKPSNPQLEPQMSSNA